MRRSTHAQRLERWLGRAAVDHLSEANRNWYGPPVAIANVPGAVYVGRGGDFVGAINGGYYSTLADLMHERMQRGLRRAALRQRRTMNAGFSSLSDLISEWTAGNKGQQLHFQKAATAVGAAGGTGTFWFCAGTPNAGAVGGAAPGGTAHDDSNTGGYQFRNPAGGDTSHLLSGFASMSVAGGALLLYDRLFSVTKTMSSTGTEAVTGVPTRYQSTTPADPDYAGGNFIIPEVSGVLGATAHNWTVTKYTDQDGNANQSAPSVAGVSSCVANRVDLAVPNWFLPLAANDIGAKALTQMQCSASVTGSVTFAMGHPLAWFPIASAQVWYPQDFVNSAFGMVRIFDDACLALLAPYNANGSPTACLSINVCAG